MTTFQIVISYDNGTVKVQMGNDNLVEVLGVIEVARLTVIEHHKQQSQQGTPSPSLLMPRGAIPPQVLKQMKGGG